MSFIEIPEPKFEEGQLVRVSRMNCIFSVWMRFYDIHNGKWSYEDENRDYECYEDELEPAYTHPDSAEPIQVPKPKYRLYTIVKEDVSEDQEWGSVIDITYNPQKGGWFYTVQYGANRKYPTGYTTIFPEYILKSWQEYKDND